jgi:aminoacyl tRNA synthase complex-interacting multifunctional protein 1
MATTGQGNDPWKSLLTKHFPKLQADVSSLDQLTTELSSTAFPEVTYSDAEKTDIKRWIDTAAAYSAGGPNQEEALKQLNDTLSTRTTILSSKPSAADLAIYAHLAPQVSKWDLEQRTGQQGHHHIIRYVDFVQSSSIFGVTIDDKDKVAIDLNDIKFIPQPRDPKEEKERKKKEKAAAAAAGRLTEEKSGSAEKKAEANKKDGKVSGETTLPVRVKKEKAPKAPKAQPAAAEAKPLSPAQIDLRVGHILRAVNHPNADSLYVSTIAMGDAPGSENTSLDEETGQTVRTVCSGLNGLIPLAEMQDRKVVCVCNLKPVTMRGVKSAAMVLAASPRPTAGEEEAGGHGGPVELVEVPTDANAGDKVFFEGYDAEPEKVLNPKKKIWESCQVGFTTTESGEVAFEEAKVAGLGKKAGEETETPLTGVKKLTTASGGSFKVPTLRGAIVR